MCYIEKISSSQFILLNLPNPIMKKNLLLIVIPLLVFNTAYAQTEKGDHTLGFNLGYLHSNSNETLISSFDSTASTAITKTTNFSIGPNYSYFIMNNLDLGASLQYSYDLQHSLPVNNQFGEKETTHMYGASVFLRKYFMCAGKIGFRTGPYLGYMHSDAKNTSEGSTADPLNDLTTKTNTFNAGINLDLVFFPSKRLGVAASIANLEYDHFKRNDVPTGDHETGDDLNFNFVNTGLVLSVFFIFGGK